MARLKPMPPAGVCRQQLQEHQLMPNDVPACQSQAGTASPLQSELEQEEQPRGREGGEAQGGEALSAAPAAAQGPGEKFWGESGSPATVTWASAGMGLPSGSYSTLWDALRSTGIFEACSGPSHPPCWAATAGGQWGLAGTGAPQGATPFPSTGSPGACWLWEGCRSPSPELLGFPEQGWCWSEGKGEHPPR